MESNQLLYLRLKLAHKEDFLDLQLQKRDFKLTEKTGTGIESFRNYHYEMAGAPGALKVSLKFIPGKNTTQTVSIELSEDIHPKHIERLFDHLKNIAISVPFDLLDLETRNQVYEKLFQEGKVDAYYVGLDEGEQLVVEQQAYIPIDAKLYIERKKINAERSQVVSTLGKRAPDLDA